MAESSRPSEPEVNKSDQQWREQLSDSQYSVTRCGGTEPAFTGAYWDNKEAGTYRCICCDEPLFTSETKFDSGTGWPSFFQPTSEESVDTKEDRSASMARTEVVCRRCGAHLGHLFPDAPSTPTGMRYCINSAALKFEQNDQGSSGG
ncbi:MAG: peptide-methionine (R)-S-oxide reductase MsrB [Pirellulales bacterium]